MYWGRLSKPRLSQRNEGTKLEKKKMGTDSEGWKTRGGKRGYLAHCLHFSSSPPSPMVLEALRSTKSVVWGYCL